MTNTIPRSSNRMRFFALSVAVASLFGAANVAAQDYKFGWNPRTGDVWVDQRLNDINQYGTRYREPFIDEISRHYGAPRDFVSDLIVRQNWAPGDVYYACSIAQVVGRPCRSVADEWNRDHREGWGAMAKRLGIKPGSAEFHRLKKGFVPTYDRWGRPIVLDADLRREFPNRNRSRDDDHRAGGHKDHGGGHDHDTRLDHGKKNHDVKHGKGKSQGKAKSATKHSSSGKMKSSGQSGKGGNGNGKGKKD